MKPGEYFKNSSYFKNKRTFYKSLEQITDQTVMSNST
jgi:hypothetical protein